MAATKAIEATETIREQLAALLDGGNAHMVFDQIVAEMEIEAANTKPPHFNYSPWQLLEHMRRAQKDILDFIRDPSYQSPPYEAFWPAEDETAAAPQWRNSVAQFRADLDEAIALARAPDTDFFSPLPHAPEYTIFREILLIADHNGYHLGELITLRQVLGAPPPKRW